MVAKKFKIYSIKITANILVSKKIESVQFYWRPQAKLFPRFLSLSPIAKTNKGIGHKFW